VVEVEGVVREEERSSSSITGESLVYVYSSMARAYCRYRICLVASRSGGGG
jgi:hypothetical protein